MAKKGRKRKKGGKKRATKKARRSKPEVLRIHACRNPVNGRFVSKRACRKS